MKFLKMHFHLEINYLASIMHSSKSNKRNHFSMRKNTFLKALDELHIFLLGGADIRRNVYLSWILKTQDNVNKQK